MEPKLRLLLDGAHSLGYAGHGKLVELLTERCQVTILDKKPLLGLKILTANNVFMLIEAQKPWEEDEVEMVRRYVESYGGILVAMTCYTANREHLNQLLAPFGLAVTEDRVEDKHFDRENLRDSPLLDGVDSLAAGKIWPLGSTGIDASDQADVVFKYKDVIMGAKRSLGRGTAYLFSCLPVLGNKQLKQEGNVRFLDNLLESLATLAAKEPVETVGIITIGEATSAQDKVTPTTAEVYQRYFQASLPEVTGGAKKWDKKCAYHPEADAVIKCDKCKQFVCAECGTVAPKVTWEGTVFKPACSQCAAKIITDMLGGGCPICKEETTLVYTGRTRKSWLCENCDAEFTIDLFHRSKLISGKSEYLGKLLYMQGWSEVRKGEEPYVCPRCGVQLTKLKDKTGKVEDGEEFLCDNCLVDLEIKGGHLVEKIVEEVASSCDYMAVVYGSHFIWPNLCCMCLGPPQELEEYQATTLGEQRGGGLLSFPTQTEYTTKISGIPYCSYCCSKLSTGGSGIHIVPIPAKLETPQEEIIGIIVGFRNPTYARMFRDLNGCYQQSIPLGV